jgi:hypothetical protein
MAIDTTRQLIQQITNASSVGENTATRVGNAMEAMLNDVKAADDKAVAATNRINTTEQSVANANQRLATEEGINATQTAQIEGLRQDIQNIRPVTIEGDVVNNPDNVFLTSANDEITPKERTTSLSAKGHYIMRPTDNFAAKLKANYIHEIPFDVDLGGASVTIPAGAVLKFTGGRITNGTLQGIVNVDAPNVQIFGNDLEVDGDVYCNAAWFGMLPTTTTDKTDASAALQHIHDMGFTEVYIPAGLYYFAQGINITHKFNIRLEGVVNHYGDNVSEPLPNSAYIFTDANVNLLNVHTNRLSFSVIGGAIDTTLCSGYTSNVINVGGDKVCKVSKMELATTIIGKPTSDGYHGGGKAISVKTTEGVSSMATFIDICCNIYAYEYGVYIKAYDDGTSWVTNVHESSIIYHCKCMVYMDTAYVCSINGSYQCGIIGASDHTDTTPAIYIKGHDYDINPMLWDVNWTGNLGKTNIVSIQFDESSYRINVGQNGMRLYTNFVGYGGINNHNSAMQLPRFANDLYALGYNELTNWLINRDDFTAAVSTTGCSVGAAWIKDLFNPQALLDASHTVAVSDANNAELTVTITFATAQQFTMLGCLTSINRNGSFGSIDVTANYVDSTSETMSYNVESYNSALYGYVYFNSLRLASKRKVTSFAVRFYNFRGSSSTKILSIFGAIRGKTLSYLTSAGGRFSGGNIANKSGDVLFVEPTTEANVNVASWAVGAFNFLTDKNGFAVKVNTAGNVRYLTPLLPASVSAGNRPNVNGAGFPVVDATSGEVYFWNGSEWVDSRGYAAGTKRYGNTASRPAAADVGGKPGYMYFDTSTKTPKFVAGTAMWVNADGSRAESVHSGYENSAPLPNAYWSTPVGFVYMCLGTVKKPLFMHSVDSSGNNVWVDAQGNAKGTSYCGTTANRPSDPLQGTMYFDTTLGKPIWYKGSSVWVDATGATV